MQKKVSVLIPVFNSEKYLNSCLKSLQQQTYSNIEVILVDDGSTDNSGDICDKYSANDKRFIVLHKKNEGVAAARIDAFNKSTGSYITFVDSDDYVTIDYIEKLVTCLESYNVDMVSSQNYVVYNQQITKTIRSVCGYFDKKGIENIIKHHFLYDKKKRMAGLTITLWSKLIKREFVLNCLNIGNGLKYSEDQLGVFNLLTNIGSMYVIPDCLYYYVKHQEQATHKYSIELWENQLEAYCRYKEIDHKKLLYNQLSWRWWIFVYMAIIYKKMPNHINSYSGFIEEIKRIDNHEGWIDFFQRKSIDLGWKNNIKFWLLKYKQYRLFYLLFLKKYYEK